MASQLTHPKNHVKSVPFLRSWKVQISADTAEKSEEETSLAFSPQANCTDLVTATIWRILVPVFVDRRVSHGQCSRTPIAVKLSFPDRSSYFFFQIAPYLSP
jgi:hypothetical protein